MGPLIFNSILNPIMVCLNDLNLDLDLDLDLRRPKSKSFVWIS